VDNNSPLVGSCQFNLSPCISPWLQRYTYANDALGANQLDELVDNGALGVAVVIGLDVAEITDVAVLIGRGTVSLAVGVD
jgi:hypothetical protein